MNLTRILTGTLFAMVCGLMVESEAQAQFAAKVMGTPGQVTVSAERLFGLNIINIESEPDVPGNPQSTEFSGTEFSILFGSRDRGLFALPPISSIPRIAVDYFVIENLSIGATAGFMTFSGKQETGNQEVEDSSTVLMVGPRVGYHVGFSETFGIWLRGGLNIISVQQERDQGNTNAETSTNLLQINAEGMFAFMPTEGFFVLAGPTFEFYVTGNNEVEQGTQSVESDISGNNIGAYFGVGGAFDL